MNTQRTPKVKYTKVAIFHIREILNKNVEMKYSFANAIAEYLNDIEDNDTQLRKELAELKLAGNDKQVKAYVTLKETPNEDKITLKVGVSTEVVDLLKTHLSTIQALIETDKAIIVQ